jgi:prepilin-type N-terminal cleavage/methylation domain-containing protein
MTRTGFSLVELMVVMAIVSITAAVATLAVGSVGTEPSPRTEWARRLDEARSEAVERGRAIVVRSDSTGAYPSALFLPDGRAVGPDVDPLTGAALP